MLPRTAASLALPRLLSPSNYPAVQTELGAHHYRLVGLEIAAVASVTDINTMVAMGSSGFDGQTTLASVAHHMVLDRLYIHGSPTMQLRRCLLLNSADTAIIDSYLADCHATGTDSQAILGYNGPGPFKIVNNYLEGAGETIMFGGSDPAIPNLVPSDIEIRHNHITRPLSWKGVWTIKNLFELKNAQRLLVEGNVMENNWRDGQEGGGVILKSVNQDNTAPWSGTRDLTFRYNIIRNVGSGFHMHASPEAKPAVHMHSLNISNNLLMNVNTPDFPGLGKGLATGGDLTDITFDHNTLLGATSGFTGMDMDGYTEAVTVRFRYTNNIAGTVNGVGLQGQTTGYAGPTWLFFAPDGVMTGNVWGVGAAFSTGWYASYPAGNLLVVNADPGFAPLGFTNFAAGDVSLLASSPAKGQAIGGGDPGVDMSALRAATSGVIIP
jgi:hypothetical protein